MININTMKRCELLIDADHKFFEHWVQGNGYRALVENISHFDIFETVDSKFYYRPVFKNGLSAKYALTEEEYKLLEKEWLSTIQ